jgi:hypothetical protein
VCRTPAIESMTFDQIKDTGCVGLYNTANFNNYIFTTPGGTGPAYSNMCVGLFEEGDEPGSKGALRRVSSGEGCVLYRAGAWCVLVAAGAPRNFIGDDAYHKYTIDWHTGGEILSDGSKTKGRVDFYIDDIFMVRRLCVVAV